MLREIVDALEREYSSSSSSPSFQQKQQPTQTQQQIMSTVAIKPDLSMLSTSEFINDAEVHLIFTEIFRHRINNTKGFVKIMDIPEEDLSPSFDMPNTYRVSVGSRTQRIMATVKEYFEVQCRVTQIKAEDSFNEQGARTRRNHIVLVYL